MVLTLCTTSELRLPTNGFNSMHTMQCLTTDTEHGPLLVGLTTTGMKIRMSKKKKKNKQQQQQQKNQTKKKHHNSVTVLAFIFSGMGILGQDKRCKYSEVKPEIPGRGREVKYMIQRDNKMKCYCASRKHIFSHVMKFWLKKYCYWVTK